MQRDDKAELDTGQQSRIQLHDSSPQASRVQPIRSGNHAQVVTHRTYSGPGPHNAFDMGPFCPRSNRAVETNDPVRNADTDPLRINRRGSSQRASDPLGDVLRLWLNLQVHFVSHADNTG